MATLEYTFRLQAADWDFGAGVGIQRVMCHHQYIDATGIPIPVGSPGGSWEPFIPGPVIEGEVDDLVIVTVQNRIEDSAGEFVEQLKTATTVHWHGIELANTYDGTPVTQKPFATGTDMVYRFKMHRPGVYWYHSHWNSMIQSLLGAYGTIIINDPATAELRTNKIIPHEDRTFNITLTDISFQDDRLAETNASWVQVANIPATPPPIYIRNINGVGGTQNFGDVHLINGKYNVPFNNVNGNFQQFWSDGERLTPTVLTANEGESMSFQLVNSGLHRFYKIHLAFKDGLGNWTRSDDLFRLGGEGGLLDTARGGGGVFNNWRIRGAAQRLVAGGGDGPNSIQSTPEFTPGEFLLSASGRIWVAFAIPVGMGFTEVALRASGFNVRTGGGGDDPVDMEIAHFTIGTTVSTTYKLPVNILHGTGLRTALAVPDPLEDLSLLPAVTSFTTCTQATLIANGVPAPDIATPMLTDYDIKLQAPGGGPGPMIDGHQPIWNDDGIGQPSGDNVRYVNSGDLVEWTVETESANSDHPWHKHGFSFQPIQIDLNDGAGNYTPLFTWDFVEYVDVIYVPFAHRVTYRFRVEERDYVTENNALIPTGGVLGRWLAHCHIFKHAHKGMMMNFIVLDTCALGDYRSADVYMRDDIGDDGSEPSSGSLWQSPDIILRKNLVVNGQASFGQGSGTENLNTLGNEAEFGDDNYIYVRMNNRGSHVAKAQTDVYWSEVSTLVSPDMWNYIGETNQIDVNPNFLTVADPLTWQDVDVPAPGHYCFVGITGSPSDPKTLSPAGAAAFTTALAWADFTALIRENNNVVWRNFNVVDLLMNIIGDDEESKRKKTLKFKFRGAFDRDREFDIEFVNPFQDVLLILPFDEQIEERLKEQEVRFELVGKEFHVTLEPKKNLTLKRMVLGKSKDYHSTFMVRDRNKDTEGKEMIAIQKEVVNEKELEEVGRVTWTFVEAEKEKREKFEKKDTRLQQLDKKASKNSKGRY